MARKGKRVLLVDVDSQANSSKVLLADYPKLTKESTLYATILERAPLVVHLTAVPNLSLVPSHILLSNTDIELGVLLVLIGVAVVGWIKLQVARDQQR